MSIEPVSLVVLQPTSFCNIACKYCYLPDRDRRNELSLETLERIVDRLAEYGNLEPTLTICWHSGEPLVRGIDFFESAFGLFNRLEKHTSVSHSIQTNGILITEPFAAFFAKHNVHVGLSIDGPAHHHDTNRVYRSGKPTHAEALRGLRLLQENKVSFGAISVIGEEALRGPEAFHDFFVANDVPSVGLNIPEIEGVNTTSWIANSEVSALYPAFLRALVECSRGSQTSYREIKSVFELASAPEDERRSSCATFGHILNFTYDGSFSTYSPELLSMRDASGAPFLMGNVATASIEEGLASQAARELRSEVNTGVQKCRKTCAYFDLCGGGSPSNKYAECGSFRAAETLYCKLSKKAVVDQVLEAMGC